VKDLVAGSGLHFDDRGVRPLRGVPGEWRLFAVAPCDRPRYSCAGCATTCWVIPPSMT
jgi:hypothetical protein